jgi:hypothetical protein
MGWSGGYICKKMVIYNNHENLLISLFHSEWEELEASKVHYSNEVASGHFQEGLPSDVAVLLGQGIPFAAWPRCDEDENLVVLAVLRLVVHVHDHVEAVEKVLLDPFAAVEVLQAQALRVLEAVDLEKNVLACRRKD